MLGSSLLLGVIIRTEVPLFLRLLLSILPGLALRCQCESIGTRYSYAGLSHSPVKPCMALSMEVARVKSGLFLCLK